MTNPVPVDDITLVYGQADALRKNSASEILGNQAFLLSCEKGYTVVAGSNLEKTVDMFSALIVQLEREYGKAFTRALMSMILQRLSLEEIKVLIKIRVTPKEDHQNEGH